MSKKIAVFTLQGLVNYGNRLQNYAVEYLLEQEGCIPQSIVVTNHPFVKPLVLSLRRTISRFWGTKAEKKEARRQSLFSRFNKNINIKYYHINYLSRLNRTCDAIVVGSDQVWNPQFDSNQIFLLPFADKRICLSPSFGVDEISKEKSEFYRRELKEFPFLSVRENSGKDLIYNLTGRTAQVLIDPTMAVEQSVWETLERKPLGFHYDNYILSYTLGEFSKKRQDTIDHVLKEYPYKHVAIFDDLKENHYIAGPGEFLWLIHHAQFIVTDSFHAAVFSILFEKKFLTFKREGTPEAMYDRIRTLLAKFGLEMCDAEKLEPDKISVPDYSHCRKQLKLEREKYMEYLRKVLPGET